MERIEILQYKDEDILLVDLSQLSPDNFDLIEEVISESEEIIRNPDHLEFGILVATDITGSKTNVDLISTLAAYVEGNKPYVKASALIGAGDSLKVVKRVIEKQTGRVFKTGFSTREKACEWLIKQ